MPELIFELSEIVCLSTQYNIISYGKLFHLFYFPLLEQLKQMNVHN